MIYARCIALRIYTKQVNRIADHPPIVKRDNLLVYGYGDASFAAVFNFGVIVFWNVPHVKQQDLISQLQPLCKTPLRPELSDEFRLDVGKPDNITYDHIQLQTLDLDDVIALSFAFAQNIVLERMEKSVTDQLHELDNILRPIEKIGRMTLQRNRLLKKLGYILRDRNHAFYDYGFQQTPPEAWNDVRIERLYKEVVTELEIPQRISMINEQWNSVNDTTQFLLSLLSEQKHFRFDVTLLLVAVVVDMLLTVWQVFGQ